MSQQKKSTKQSKLFTPEKIPPKALDSNISTNPYTGEFGKSRKGIIPTTINNVAVLNKELILSEPNIKTITDITLVMKPLLEPLKFTGIFDFFTPLEWISAKDQPGRVLVGVWYLQKNPKKMTFDIKNKLLQIRSETKSIILSDEISKLGV